MSMRDGAPTYRLLDSGGRRKLEECGGFRLVRPAPQAVWAAELPRAEWERFDAEYLRSRDGGGEWNFRRGLPAGWPIEIGGLELELRATGFGHVGVFAEQVPAWGRIESWCRSMPPGGEVLNLFAYTGGSTLAAARGGARVCHLDASQGVVKWARANAARSGLGAAPIRWIVDEASKFVRREVRRNRTYRGLVLDPPSFGRGPRGEVFKIEQDLPLLLEDLGKLLDPDPEFVLLSAHSPGFSPLVLKHLVSDLLGDRRERGTLQAEEMCVECAGRVLPSGARAWWERRES